MSFAAEIARANALADALNVYATRALPGLTANGARFSLARQMVDSERRIAFAHHLRDAPHSSRRADPHDDLFDPLRAAVLHNRLGDVDNAGWLVFLGTHFGKHEIDGWRLARDIYGRLGASPVWDWPLIENHFADFEAWYRAAMPVLANDGTSRRFSNHRKYESLTQVVEVFRSYRDWAVTRGGHVEMVREFHRTFGQHPGETFDALFMSLDEVRRFGRLAKFDYVTMLGKLGISPVEPPSPYLLGATGPLKGARLIFTNDRESDLQVSKANQWTIELGSNLGLGMQVMEDALCNWQKSPTAYVRFRG